MKYQGGGRRRAWRTAQCLAREFEPFVEHANQLVTILASQEGAVRALVHNTGVVFNALAGRDHQMEGLIVNGETHLPRGGRVEARSSPKPFEALPEFEHQSTVALKTLDAFAVVSNPYLDEVKPVERQLTHLLQTAKRSRRSQNFLTAVGRSRQPPKRGLPESAKVFNLTVPVA